jgi:hypothetical protein
MLVFSDEHCLSIKNSFVWRSFSTNITEVFKQIGKMRELFKKVWERNVNVNFISYNKNKKAVRG